MKNSFKNLPLKKWQSITKSSIRKNAYVNSWRLVKRDREQFITIKEKADEEKLAKVQAYVRQTLMPFDFTDEESFQVSKCVVSLVVHGVVVLTLPIKIEKTGKKEKLTRNDLANLSWNIVYQCSKSFLNSHEISLNTLRSPQS